MTLKKIELLAIPICSILLAATMFPTNFSNDNESFEVQSSLIPLVFAEKPTQEIIDLTANLTSTDYATNSTFIVESAECKISTKGGVTEVNWCKTIAIQNQTAFYGLFAEGEISFGAFLEQFSTIMGALFNSLITGEGFEQTLVEYEVDTLTSEMDAILEAEFPGIVIPEDYSTKSVELKWILESDEPNEPISQTEVEVKIEY